MVFRPIIGTLVYLLDRESNSVLLIKRDARPQDDHYGKFNGLGGKLEPVSYTHLTLPTNREV